MKESSTPKLSLLSRSSMWEWELPEAQGCKTPPIIASLSIPFKWEEAPGKPKPRDIPTGLTTSRSLHLPPRLLVHDHGSPPAGTKLQFSVSSLRSRSCSSRADLASHPPQWRKLESPTSILNSPPPSSTNSSSRGSSSTCSQYIDEMPLPRLHKMRRLLEHWTPSLRWPKLKEHSTQQDDHHKSDWGCQSQAMPSAHAFTASASKKWVLIKLKRSSRVFGTILKRMRSRKEDSCK